MDITERLRNNSCRYASETHDAAAKRRISVEIEAAAEIEKLRHALTVLLEEAEGFSVSGVYFNEKCHQHKGPDLAREVLYPTASKGTPYGTT